MAELILIWNHNFFHIYYTIATIFNFYYIFLMKTPLFQISIMLITPTQGIALLKAGFPKEVATSKLVALIIGGTRIDPKYITLYRKLLPNTLIFSGYGQTEIIGAMVGYKFSNRKHLMLMQKNPTSCGLPMDGRSYKVRRDFISVQKKRLLQLRLKMFEMSIWKKVFLF